MRNGYILLHRKGITLEEWKHPLRTLAWIDLLTLAAYEEYTTADGVRLRQGELIASISFLETRWKQNRGTIQRWLLYWESQQMVQRVVQQPSQQLPQRLFIVNYAKYQGEPQRPPQQVTQRVPQQLPQLMKVKEEKEKKENTDGGFENDLIRQLTKQEIAKPRSYLLRLRQKIGNDEAAIRKAWGDWKHGVGIETPGQFWSRCIHYHKQTVP